MAMSGGNGIGSAVSEINVTPLIDVLLVLLIIFMVIVPAVPKGLEALVPQPAKREQPVSDATIVVSVLGQQGVVPSYRINGEVLSKADVASTLRKVFAVRQDKVMFVKGDAGLSYSQVAEVIDMGHEAGVDNIGIITPKVAQGD
jgi:biopolymer transport protein ExbD/biopolymer transport protein TolR